MFEFYLLIDRRVFGYRVAVSRREVVEEHLSEAPLDDPGQERVVFSRAGAEFELGAALSTGTDPGFIEYIARGTRANQPFLNEAHERSLAVLEPVYQWFASTLVIIAPHTRYGPLVEEAVAQRGELERGYLQGRFGAIPFIGDPRRLHWPTHDPSK